MSDQIERTAESIAERALALGIRIGCAETFTSGLIASYLGRASRADEWFAGGIVAFGDDVKCQLLKVANGRMITAKCASAMATGTTSALRVQHAVAVVGVGGPETVEGRSPGTVFIGLATGTRGRSLEFHFSGDRADVVEEATHVALLALLARIGGEGSATASGSVAKVDVSPTRPGSGDHPSRG
ncbi:MAG: nicotinamide-nucleotide amidohydrolase family protein [Leifsonia sp.]